MLAGATTPKSRPAGGTYFLLTRRSGESPSLGGKVRRAATRQHARVIGGRRPLSLSFYISVVPFLRLEGVMRHVFALCVAKAARSVSLVLRTRSVILHCRAAPISPRGHHAGRATSCRPIRRRGQATRTATSATPPRALSRLTAGAICSRVTVASDTAAQQQV